MDSGKLRYVLFMDNAFAEMIAEMQKDTYTGAFVGVCVLNGLYPLSPSDIAEYVRAVPEVEHCAIVECFMPFNALGMFHEIKREDIISVNKCVTEYVYAPLRKVQASCAFNSMTDIRKDMLGWHRPMAGISYLRNKQCMKPNYYRQMFETLAQSKGAIYVEFLEQYFKDMLLTESFMEKYKL